MSKSILDEGTSGIIERPHLVLAYALDGVGKTTFASGAPDVVIIDPERGSFNLPFKKRLVPKNWEHAIGYIDAIRNDKHDYKTLCLDNF